MRKRRRRKAKGKKTAEMGRQGKVTGAEEKKKDRHEREETEEKRQASTRGREEPVGGGRGCRETEG